VPGCSGCVRRGTESSGSLRRAKHCGLVVPLGAVRSQGLKTSPEAAGSHDSAQAGAKPDDTILVEG
jgi:hypothetical protein